MDRAQAELDALKRTEEDLKKGHQKLEEMISRLDQEVVRHAPTFGVKSFCRFSHSAHILLNICAPHVSTRLKLTGILSC